MRRPPDLQLLGFLEAYDRPIADLVLALREIILEEVPDASESIIDLSGLHRRDLVRLQRKDVRTCSATSPPMRGTSILSFREAHGARRAHKRRRPRTLDTIIRPAKTRI